MNDNERDDHLDVNLRALGGRLRDGHGPSQTLLNQCLSELERRSIGAWRLTMRKYKRPVLFSGMSLAAAVALFVGLLWPGTDPRAYAARITETLARQSQGNPLVHVEFQSLSVEEVTVNGRVQVGQAGVAGDLRISVAEDDGVLRVSAAIGATKEGAWILVRELSVPDPQAQAFLGLLLPPGQETLVLLPKHGEIAEEVSDDIQEGLEELQSGELIEVFKKLIDQHAEYGVTVEEQADGTVRLVLPIEDEEALEAIARLVERVDETEGIELKADVRTGKKRSAHSAKVTHRTKIEHHIEAHSEDHGASLIGATLSAVYDPAAEKVRMLSITGLGDAKGAITVTLGEGDVDPALLDSGRVAKPGTRTLDLAGMESLIHGLSHEHE